MDGEGRVLRPLVRVQQQAGAAVAAVGQGTHHAQQRGHADAAADEHVPPPRINEIVHGKRAVTADTALRLARYFGTSPRFWLNLQAQYDLDVHSDALGDRLDREITARAGWVSCPDDPSSRRRRVRCWWRRSSYVGPVKGHRGTVADARRMVRRRKWRIQRVSDRDVPGVICGALGRSSHTRGADSSYANQLCA